MKRATGPIGDEELIACLPEIIKRSDPVGETPTLVEHVRQHPRLVDLAKPQLGVAAAQLVVDGWSPTRAAQAGQWDVLVTIAAPAPARSARPPGPRALSAAWKKTNPTLDEMVTSTTVAKHPRSRS